VIEQVKRLHRFIRTFWKWEK